MLIGAPSYRERTLRDVDAQPPPGIIAGAPDQHMSEALAGVGAVPSGTTKILLRRVATAGAAR
jgi:hypothetical protein